MKSLQLNLEKKLLIVDFKSKEKFDSFLECDFAIEHKDKECKLLYIGSEMTEEYASELVFRSKIGNYKDYSYKEGTLPNSLLDALRQMKFKTAKESFISAIEYEGFYWLENPNGQEPHNIGLINTYPTGHPLMDISLKEAIDWQESESRTLRFPIIFEILE